MVENTGLSLIKRLYLTGYSKKTKSKNPTFPAQKQDNSIPQPRLSPQTRCSILIFLADQAGISGYSLVYTATDSEETHPPSPTKLQASDTCAAHIASTSEQAVLWGRLLLSQSSPAIIASSGCVFVLFTHHQPASASPAVEDRGGSEAGVKRGQE